MDILTFYHTYFIIL